MNARKASKRVFSKRFCVVAMVTGAWIVAGCDMKVTPTPTPTPEPTATPEPSPTPEPTPTPTPEPQIAYVGTDTCLGCHGPAEMGGHPDKSDFKLTGHPFKLNKVTNGEPPTYPVTTLPSPPEGLEWTDTSYVIGGYRWKYRVIDLDGFIVLGPTAQYNFPSETFSAYSNDDSHTAPDGTPGPWDTNIGREPYACGPCHMTAYDADTPSRTGLEGFVGDWEFDGIQCEECHGPGGNHQTSLSAADINGSPDSDAVCGKCHIRNADGIEASGGFIRHHEQWDEFSRSVHYQKAGFEDGCMTCHNVHKPLWDTDKLAAIQASLTDPTAMDQLDTPPGIIKECTDCHTDKTVTHPQVADGVDIECISCHMAFTGKSAQKINDDMGDVRSHLFAITDDPDAKFFTDADGNPVDRDGAVKFVNLDANGYGHITLDFACLRCHTDKDVAWAAANAESIHGG